MTLAPVTPSERVASLDVLRGLALYGVLTANLVWIVSGIELLPRDRVDRGGLAGFYMNMFVSGRAIATLTFLFGLGFALQLARAEARGEDVRGVFVRRLLALLGFGVAHVLLLWWGDVLWTYALAGFALLWFRRVGVRALLAWAAVLIFVPRFVAALPPVHDAIAALAPHPASQDAFKAELLATLGGSDRAAMTWAHVRWATYHVSAIAPWYFPWVLGHFLLGMAAGKARIFERDGADHRRLFRWLLALGIAVPIVGVAAMFGLRALTGGGGMGHGGPPPPVPARLAFGVLQEVVTLGVATLYVSAVVLLLRLRIPRRALTLVAPVGRMPLTTYLTQSLLTTFVCYGWGLGWIGELAIPTCIAIALAIYATQVVIAHLWLRRFRSGPLERLWRAISYRAPRAAALAPGTTTPTA